MSSSTPENPNENRPSFRLGTAASDALDRLAQAGFDPSMAGGSPGVQRLAALLALLDTPTAARARADESRARSLLVDVTLARVLRERERGLAGRIQPATPPPTLTHAAAMDVDALVESGWREHGREKSRTAALLAMLTPGGHVSGSADREALVEATLRRVQDDIDSSSGRFRLDAERLAGGVRSAWRLSDLVAAAAAVFFAASVLWPMLAGSREQARREWCTAGLSAASMGFGMYALDHQAQLPRIRPSFYGGTWWEVGRPERSHSANLYLLVRQGYTTLDSLACPGNHDAPAQSTVGDAADWRVPEEVSYSFQLFSPRRPGWGSDPRLVILADRSPVVQRARLGESADPNACSLNHAGRGQNLLLGDGSIRFADSPVLSSGDNIWLPGPHRSGPVRLMGRETPADDSDSFVGP